MQSLYLRSRRLFDKQSEILTINKKKNDHDVSEFLKLVKITLFATDIGLPPCRCSSYFYCFKLMKLSHDRSFFS